MKQLITRNLALSSANSPTPAMPQTLLGAGISKNWLSPRIAYYRNVSKLYSYYVLWDSLPRFCSDSGILLVGYAGAQLSKTGNSNTGSEGAVRPNVGRQVYNVDVWRVDGMSSGCAGQTRWQLFGTSQLQYARRRLRLTDSAVSARLQVILGDQLRMCSR